VPYYRRCLVGRWRHDHSLDATHDKSKILTIIGNKNPYLLHSVLNGIHECKAVGERGSEMVYLDDAVAARTVQTLGVRQDKLI
jgi:hypothetical protein